MAELSGAATEAVAEAAEAVAEEATEVAEVARAIDPARITYAAVGAAAGLALGLLVGYQFAYRRLETKFEKIAEDEIDQMREHFRARNVARDGEVVKPGISELKDRIEDAGYVPKGEEEQEEEGSTTDEVVAPAPPGRETENVFETVDPEAPGEPWDQEHEENSRQEGVPYVIHKDEWGEKDYTETTLTYYAPDDVLADEREKPIEDQDKVVGVGNMDRFGHGSQDANVVLIRNDELGVDLEVCRSQASYSEVVAGFEHAESQRRPRRRPSPDDE